MNEAARPFGGGPAAIRPCPIRPWPPTGPGSQLRSERTSVVVARSAACRRSCRTGAVLWPSLSRSAEKRPRWRSGPQKQIWLCPRRRCLEVLSPQTPELGCAGRGKRPPTPARPRWNGASIPFDANHQLTSHSYPFFATFGGASPGGVAACGCHPSAGPAPSATGRPGLGAWSTTAAFGEAAAAIWPRRLLVTGFRLSTRRASPNQTTPKFLAGSPPHPWRPGVGLSAGGNLAFVAAGRSMAYWERGSRAGIARRCGAR